MKKYDGTTWVQVGSTGFSAGTASYVSLALGSSNTPYVAYTDGKASVMNFGNIVKFTAGANGTIKGAASQTVNDGSSSTAVEAVPNQRGVIKSDGFLSKT